VREEAVAGQWPCSLQGTTVTSSVAVLPTGLVWSPAPGTRCLSTTIICLLCMLACMLSPLSCSGLHEDMASGAAFSAVCKSCSRVWGWHLSEAAVG
jgi:hypothetical protein